MVSLRGSWASDFLVRRFCHCRACNSLEAIATAAISFTSSKYHHHAACALLSKICFLMSNSFTNFTVQACWQGVGAAEGTAPWLSQKPTGNVAATLGWDPLQNSVLEQKTWSRELMSPVYKLKHPLLNILEVLCPEPFTARLSTPKYQSSERTRFSPCQDISASYSPLPHRDGKSWCSWSLGLL